MDWNNWNKDTLLDVSNSYWQSSTLHTGVKLEIFTLLGEQAQTAEALANTLGGDKRGVATLLNALAAMGLLTKSGETFANTAFSTQYLCKDSRDYSGFLLMYHHHLMKSWMEMSDSILSGKPNRTSSSDARSNVSDADKEQERESYLMGMFNMASRTAPLYAEMINLDDATNLLDFGGGPGTYAIYFAQQNPHLQATVFDLPTTRQFAQKTIASFGLAERVKFQGGSFLDDAELPLGQDYDVIWLSHVLHGESPQEAEVIVAKAISLLKPGGKILIHDFILDNTLDGPLFPALFSLNMLLATEKGQSYSEGLLKEILEKHGIGQVERLHVKTPNHADIVMGVKA